MRYGTFDKNNQEYVINNPCTPTPWINYLGNDDFGGIISQTGGGYCFDRDPRHKRILRYRYNSIPEDQPGRYIYVKDIEQNIYWSATWQPVKAEYDFFQCRHGPGYSIITQKNRNITTKITYFVPREKPMEIWWLNIKNDHSKKKDIDLFSYAEFSLFNAVLDQQNVDWAQQIQQGTFQDNTIFWNAFMEKTDYTFMTSNLPATSFETSRNNFIGRYRDLSNPRQVETGICDNYEAKRGNGVGVLKHSITLRPGEEKDIIYYLGTSPEICSLDQKLKQYNKIDKIKSELTNIHNYWQKYFDSCQVKTPDENINLMLNTWNPYQCKITFNWSRFVSLYQLGINRGMGFRDSAQDTLGVMHAIPDKCRQLLIQLFKCQHPDGNSFHLFFPLTGKGTSGEAGENENVDWYSDDHLWIIIATTAYIKETGDIDFLRETIPYSRENTEGTVLNHLRKALEFTQNHRGQHSLPLSGYADWNDTLNLEKGKGIAESVWTGMLYAYCLREIAQLMDYLGNENEKNKYEKLYKQQKEALNNYGWGTNWYLRAYDEDMTPLGEDKIFLNPQSWAILAGITDNKRKKIILDNVNKYLDTEFGVVLLHPAFSAYDDKIGGLTTYPPGAKENGGIFMHSNPWIIIAETLAGNNNRAYKYYKQVLPTRHNDEADRYEVEPYVFCQNILGKEHPQFGLGRNSWLTGTASWMYRAAIHYILGIKPEYRGIVVEPCVPDHWNEYKVKRKMRGRNLHFSFQRGKKKKIILNGSKINSVNLIKYKQLEKGRNNIQVFY
ncbi:MAG: GH36-type glycosyl hydrolase domain-containing protein [Halanaerobiales bacterium]